MERFADDFPGFQTFVPRDEFVSRRPNLSRLQRRAPRPLHLKPTGPVECGGLPKSAGHNLNSSPLSAATTSSSCPFASYYHSKDPIPLLSPLVLPSFLESGYIQDGNAAKSHSFP